MKIVGFRVRSRDDIAIILEDGSVLDGVTRAGIETDGAADLLRLRLDVIIPTQDISMSEGEMSSMGAFLRDYRPEQSPGTVPPSRYSSQSGSGGGGRGDAIPPQTSIADYARSLENRLVSSHHAVRAAQNPDRDIASRGSSAFLTPWGSNTFGRPYEAVGHIDREHAGSFREALEHSVDAIVMNVEAAVAEEPEDQFFIDGLRQ